MFIDNNELSIEEAQKIDVNKIDEYDKNTPLHFVYNPDIVKLWIQEKKADINAKNKYGLTPIQNMATKLSKESIKVYEEAGYDLNQIKIYDVFNWEKPTVEVLKTFVKNFNISKETSEEDQKKTIDNFVKQSRNWDYFRPNRRDPKLQELIKIFMCLQNEFEFDLSKHPILFLTTLLFADNKIYKNITDFLECVSCVPDAETATQFLELTSDVSNKNRNSIISTLSKYSRNISNEKIKLLQKYGAKGNLNIILGLCGNFFNDFDKIENLFNTLETPLTQSEIKQCILKILPEFEEIVTGEYIGHNVNESHTEGSWSKYVEDFTKLLSFLESKYDDKEDFKKMMEEQFIPLLCKQFSGSNYKILRHILTNFNNIHASNENLQDLINHLEYFVPFFRNYQDSCCGRSRYRVPLRYFEGVNLLLRNGAEINDKMYDTIMKLDDDIYIDPYDYNSNCCSSPYDLNTDEDDDAVVQLQRKLYREKWDKELRTKINN